MPKPLDERIAAALNSNARAATVAELIEELGTAITTGQTEHDRLDTLSKSATASEDEADAAADDAAKLARKIVRLGAKREQLQARHTELLNSDRRRKAVAAHGEVKARRDALVDDLRRDVPRLFDELTGLLERIVTVEAECVRVNRDGSGYGLEHLDGPEETARGCSQVFSTARGPILRLIDMTIPHFEGDQNASALWAYRARGAAE